MNRPGDPVIEATVSANVLSGTLREPYVGPTPYSTRDEAIFCGRRREAQTVGSLLVSSRLLLLYAPSGAGKTSLINAGVAPRLIREGIDWQTAPRFVDVTGLEELLAFETVDLERPPTTRWYNGDYAGLRVIVFDQFEEIYTANKRLPPADVFSLIANLVSGETATQLSGLPDRQEDVHVLLVLREDFYARFAADARAYWGRQPVEYRLGSLQRDAIEEAIVVPLEVCGIRIEPPAVAALLKILTDRSSPTLAGSQPVTASRARQTGGTNYDRWPLGTGHVPDSHLGPSVLPANTESPVELVELQIVCQRLWRRAIGDRTPGRRLPQPRTMPWTANRGRYARPHSVDVITSHDVREHAAIDEALQEFVEGAIATVSHRCTVSRARLIDWVRQHLLTSSNTRSLVFRGPECTEGLPNRVIDELDTQGLIRAEQRGNDKWYELAHDSLVSAVVLSHTSMSQHHRWRWLLVGLLVIAVALGGALLFVALLGDVRVEGSSQLLAEETPDTFSLESTSILRHLDAEEVVGFVPVEDGVVLVATDPSAPQDTVIEAFDGDRALLTGADDNLRTYAGNGDVLLLDTVAGSQYYIRVRPFYRGDAVNTSLLVAPEPLPRVQAGQEIQVEGGMAAYQFTVPEGSNHTLFVVDVSAGEVQTTEVSVGLLTSDGKPVFPVSSRWSEIVEPDASSIPFYVLPSGEYVVVTSGPQDSAYSMEIRVVDIN
jgi:hypothetical protein